MTPGVIKIIVVGAGGFVALVVLGGILKTIWDEYKHLIKKGKK